MLTQRHFIVHLLLSLAVGWVSLTPTAWAENIIPQASDFRALQQEMRRKGLPLLLAFRADYCGFCRQLETEHLEPMLRSGQYDSRILIRRFDMGSDQTVIDFNGDKINADEFAERHQASLTPTLLFLDAEGKEVAERLLGYNSPDFYGAYLEQAISTAQQAVN
jgi:thioredoxin-related protein